MEGEEPEGGEGDEEEETAERRDDGAKEGVEAAGEGGGGEGRGSDGCKEPSDGGEGESRAVQTKGSAGRKCVPGIIYLGHIPPRLRPKHLRNMLASYGEVGRVFLQPEGREALRT